jgi:hypothetical protein
MSRELAQVLFAMGLVFVPTLVAALVMVRSARRALALSSTFAVAAVLGFVAFGHLGWLLMEHHDADDRSKLEILLFGTAGGAGCGVLAVWLLGKLTGHPPWRRDA